jgi:hypothetical protein
MCTYSPVNTAIVWDVTPSLGLCHKTTLEVETDGVSETSERIHQATLQVAIATLTATGTLNVTLIQ